MAQTDDGRRYLPGVARLSMAATIGPANAFPQQRMKKSFSESNFPVTVACPNRCHGGGYELALDVHDNVVRREHTEHQGVLKCRGFEEMGRGRRQSCNYTLQYAVKVAYGAAHL